MTKNDAPHAGSPWTTGLATAGILALAVGTWIAHFGGRFFPLNDGALFAAFSEGVAETFPALPACVDFNGRCIPFGYPPLAFLLGGGLIRAGADPIGLLVWYPVAATLIASVILIAVLRRVFARDLSFLFAALLFVLIPRSHEWLIMGGGLTRATGAVFFALTLLLAIAPGRGLGRAVLAGVTAGLAALSHPEWGLDAALAIVVFRLVGAGQARRSVAPPGEALGDEAREPIGQRLTWIVIAGAIAVILVAPWAVWALATLGPEPFASASATSPWGPGSIIAGMISFDPIRQAASIPAIIGIGICLLRGRMLWPYFFFGLMLLTPRHFLSAAPVAKAVLGAIAIEALLDRIGPERRRMAARALAAALVLGLSFATFRIASSARTLEQLDPDVIAGADWSRAALPPGQKFLILSGELWFVDETSEWFPYLSGHISIATVQGSEWVGVGVFENLLDVARHVVVGPCERFETASERLLKGEGYVLIVGRGECFPDTDRFVPVWSQGEVRVLRLASVSSAD